ncbi:uncharacterized protein LOC114251553 [Bombyx mandarina]|uniref:Mab-21-like HhH/H2TH-like domain-containing protein n=3 Tax=Bombyx TaxID=7090 RepID=A0A8R1WIR0_BOMMO|nr:uncharacterized protein LOC101746893 isoform X1 [Bombyx mori]XP_028041668.1 uncharacterized protein LOC114251553 [Bombyx mandarina]
MGNSKSKKAQKEPDRFFERERWKEQQRGEKRKKHANWANRRVAAKEPPLMPVIPGPSPMPGPSAPPPPQIRSYDEDAIDRMRRQLNNDSDAFLLNNILLSVQFFENYESETQNIKNNPMSEREHSINEAMVRRNKHVFFADRLQECVHEHICYQRKKGHPAEPLVAPKLFVIYDNVEASEPGDTSDYSAVLDAPFYKLRIEDCKEPGYVKLKKLEVLESTLHKEVENPIEEHNMDDSIYTDSEKESFESDDSHYVYKGEDLLRKIQSKLQIPEQISSSKTVELNTIEIVDGRRPSGPIKQVSLQAIKGDISNINELRQILCTNVPPLTEEQNLDDINNNDAPKMNANTDVQNRSRKSILKNSTRLSSVNPVNKQQNNLKIANEIGDDTETSGYRSNSSSRQNEFSETESDYGYSTITEAATPKKVELKMQSNYALASGVLPEESWTAVEIRALDNWSDEDDEEEVDTASSSSLPKTLYERYYYLNSVGFMNNFVDNFIINLGSGLGLTHDAVSNALTQGASIYCDSIRIGLNIGYEIFPALIAAWPNTACPWIIRLRRAIQNPRTNFSYQWPTRYMVNKATGFGCLLVPVGFRSKRGSNPEQTLQWRILFPAAERYLESCLAHSHIRCYLFTLLLHKSFMENETSKIGIDASHIKNHLFWQCEDNYAKWPEDRLGESLRLFLRSFYIHFGQSRFPNYFIESCNDFKSIPKPLLLKLQRRLADILEAPVMHMLSALSKLKYMNQDFYPEFDCHRLYQILTCKNPLHLINPHIPTTVNNYTESSDSEGDTGANFWDNAKSRDKHYQWKKERQKQIQERRKAHINNKRSKLNAGQNEIKTNIILPAKMETERKRLVLEFFIPHFIAMARSSEKFEAVKQSIIYLEQAQRLCMLLLEEPAGDATANEYLDIIRDKLSDCQRKLAVQGRYILPHRKENKMDRSYNKPIRKHRPKFEQIVSQDSPVENHGISAFTFADIHDDVTSSIETKPNIRINDITTAEESRL